VLAPRWFMLRAVQRPEELLLLNARRTCPSGKRA